MVLCIHVSLLESSNCGQSAEVGQLLSDVVRSSLGLVVAWGGGEWTTRGW